MSIKKLVSVIAASAMLLSSAFSLVGSVSAYTTLQPLKTIKASATISGYTDETLKEVPLAEILDSMTYAEDIYEDVTVEETALEALTESTADSSEASSTAAESGNTEPTAEVIENTVPEGIETTTPENIPTAENVSEANEPAAQANTERVLVHKIGDKIEFADNAKYVWVGNEEYSIFDRNATVNLSKYGNIMNYTLNLEIIVGKAKQLSTTDIIYDVTINVNHWQLELDDVSFYYMKDGKEIPINNTFNGKYDDRLFYKSTEKLFNVDIYLKATPSIVGKSNVEFEITDLETDLPVSFPCKMIRSLYRNAHYVGLAIIAKEGDSVLYDREVYIDIDLADNELFLEAGFANNFSIPYPVRNYINSNAICEIKLLKLDFPGTNAAVWGFRNNDKLVSDDIIEKIVVGNFSSLIEAQNEKDVKNYLLGSGYEADYENGVEFTVFFNGNASKYFDGDPKNEYVYHVNITTDADLDADENNYSNAYFNLLGIKDENGKELNALIFRDGYDGFLLPHYLTAFVYSNSAVDMSRLKIVHSSTGETEIYDANKAHKINFDEPQDFTKGAISYTVAANGGQQIYTVAVKCNTTGGAKLFVNGPTGDETRIVCLNTYNDIIIANIGDEPLENLKVELSDAVNVKLDDYWRLDGDPDSSTLSAFTSTATTGNLAKIRLKCIGGYTSGDIRGTLTVTAKDQTPITIKLVGYVDTPVIITKSPLPDAVKYVPYSVAISTNNTNPGNKITFELVNGELPNGVELNRKTGEIYGVPHETGEFSVEIRAISSINKFPSTSKKFDLTVKDNTDENVYRSSDEGYSVKTSIGEAANQFDFVLPETEITKDQKFVSTGKYEEFIDFWLNGKKLEKGKDYTSEEGSTVITVKSQTISKLPKGKANTIAAEFRVNGDRNAELKHTAQNFVIKGKTTKPDDPDSTPDTSTSTPDTSTSTSDTSTSTSDTSTSIPDTSISTSDTSTSIPDTSTSTPDTSTNIPDTSTSTPDTSTSTPDTSTSIPDTSSGTSTPSESNTVFKSVHVDGELADIINGITVTAPKGVMSVDAVLTVKPDGSVPDDKGTALDFTFMLNGENIQPSGYVTVRMPVPANLRSVSPLYVYHIADGKYELVDSWRDGDFICFKADRFSTYIVSGRRLDGSGNEITADIPETSENPLTGIGVSAIGLLISGTALTVILMNKEKHRY